MEHHAHRSWVARAGLAHVGHDLTGLQAAIAWRATAVVLEELKRRKIQILMKGFKRAGDQLPVVAIKFGARNVGPDLESLEIGLLPAPGLLADRDHRRPEKRLDLGLDDFIDQNAV